jgi:hypothetical protein
MTRAPDSPLAALDRAIELARTEPWTRLFASALPGLSLSWLCMLAYYFEWVEGVHSLRPAFALALALAYCARCALLARYAGQFVDRLLLPAGGLPRHAPLLVTLRAAPLLGAELWLWLWLPIFALRFDLLLVPATLPLLALRGALLPGWLAAADGAPEPLLSSGLGEAMRAAQGRRAAGALAELFLLLSALILALNLGALSAAVISVAHDVFGLELSFARAFISPRNHFTLIVMAGLSLSALEPLRAALSAVHYADYRSAQEAITVRALVERCVARDLAKGVAASALGLMLALPGAARAEEPSLNDWSPGHTLSASEECDHSCREARARDDALLIDLVSILERPEFREFPDRRWPAGQERAPSLDSWLERFLDWLFPRSAPHHDRPAHALPNAPLRARALLGAGALLGLVLAALSYLALRRRKRVETKRIPRPSRPDPEPAARAQTSASDAPLDARGELRALYLGSLRELDARGLLRLASHATNGAYLRALAAAPERALLSELTALFERTRYGASVPSADELARARALRASLRGGGGL